MSTIRKIGGLPAITALRSLIERNAYRGRQGLGPFIRDMEDDMIAISGLRWDARELVAFILQDSRAVINNERDPFEWSIDVLEETKHELEEKGEGVDGFWNSGGPHRPFGTPKTEPEIQNVLWPRVRDKLARRGVVGIEERFVGANRAGFFVIKTAQPNLQVAIEIKVAHQQPSQLVSAVADQLWAK